MEPPAYWLASEGRAMEALESLQKVPEPSLQTCKVVAKALLQAGRADLALSLLEALALEERAFRLPHADLWRRVELLQEEICFNASQLVAKPEDLSAEELPGHDQCRG
ncbi:hypothetical protein AK812_SmicGene43849 [Symbiodinium microadriaticum]|uniref:Uncharacterized protein n=1 Tax=Symbiodinium microadriaticum TaxID=2951 RepID=A0A1Q9BZZ1_SYMMI|nr:hypothetical protein AK812_SmicGene43849 [Symbiodinium microadriaticum]